MKCTWVKGCNKKAIYGYYKATGSVHCAEHRNWNINYRQICTAEDTYKLAPQNVKVAEQTPTNKPRVAERRKFGVPNFTLGSPLAVIASLERFNMRGYKLVNWIEFSDYCCVSDIKDDGVRRCFDNKHRRDGAVCAPSTCPRWKKINRVYTNEAAARAAIVAARKN